MTDKTKDGETLEMTKIIKAHAKTLNQNLVQEKGMTPQTTIPSVAMSLCILTLVASEKKSIEEDVHLTHELIDLVWDIVKRSESYIDSIFDEIKLDK